MEEKVKSIETDIALIKSDINNIKNRPQDLPIWLKNSAMFILITMLGQIMTSIWWAASITANLANVTTEVNQNTKFRMGYPAMHEEVMVQLKGIQTDNKHIESMLKEVKTKLRFVDIKSQVNEK